MPVDPAARGSVGQQQVEPVMQQVGPVAQRGGPVTQPVGPVAPVAQGEPVAQQGGPVTQPVAPVAQGGPVTQPVAVPSAQQSPVQVEYAPGPSVSGGFRRRVGVLVGVSIVVVAAVVAVIVLAPWRSDSASFSAAPPAEAGPNGRGGFHWSLTRDEAGFSEGLWATPDHVVFGHSEGLTAYDVKSGKEIWSWDLPDRNYLCTMSQTVAGDLGAVTYGPREPNGGKNCHHLQTISVRTGQPNWPKPVSLVADGYSGWLGPIGGASLSISDTVVTAAYAGPGSQPEHSTDLTWVDTRTGQRMGATNAGAEPVHLGCRLTGHAQAQRDSVVTIAMCTGDAPMLLTWQRRTADWGLTETLEGCGEVSHLTSTVFMHPGHDGQLLIGCFDAQLLQRVYHVNSDGSGGTSLGLDGHAVAAVGPGEGAGKPPENALLDDRDVYLPRGDRSSSNGVIATTNGRSWEYAVRDASEVRLLAADNKAVTLLVVQPGPARLYTVSGPNKAEEAPALAPEVAGKLSGAKQTVRVGDYLVCAFTGADEGSPAIGVVRVKG